MADLKCATCGSTRLVQHGTDVLARPLRRVVRMKCRDCGKRTRTGTILPLQLREGYLDIETSDAGRGAGNFGVIYSYAIKVRDSRKVYYDILRTRGRKAEKSVIKNMLRDLKNFDLVYTYWGTGHDIPIMRTRCEFHGLNFPGYSELLHKDIYFDAKRLLNLHSKRLASVAEFMGVSTKTGVKPTIWADAKIGTLTEFRKAMKYILPHNIEDVWTLERVHRRLEKYGLGTLRSA